MEKIKDTVAKFCAYFVFVMIIFMIIEMTSESPMVLLLGVVSSTLMYVFDNITNNKKGENNEK